MKTAPAPSWKVESRQVDGVSMVWRTQTDDRVTAESQTILYEFFTKVRTKPGSRGSASGSASLSALSVSRARPLRPPSLGLVASRSRINHHGSLGGALITHSTRHTRKKSQ